jgi:hypothetical protein
VVSVEAAFGSVANLVSSQQILRLAAWLSWHTSFPTIERTL